MIQRNKKPDSKLTPVQQEAVNNLQKETIVQSVPMGMGKPKQEAQTVPVQKSASFYETPVLNAGQTECNVHDNLLQIGNQIYFMLPQLTGVSIGKIELFSNVGGSSSWMYLLDVQTGEHHWVSVYNWAQYNAAGVFNAIDIKKPEPKLIAEKPAF